MLANLQRVSQPLTPNSPGQNASPHPPIKSLLILFSGLATCLGSLHLLSRDTSNVGLQSIAPTSSQPRLKRPLHRSLGGLVRHQVRALPFTTALGFSPQAAQGQFGLKGKAGPNYCKLESPRELLTTPLPRSHPTDQSVWMWEPGISISFKASNEPPSLGTSGLFPSGLSGGPRLGRASLASCRAEQWSKRGERTES